MTAYCTPEIKARLNTGLLQGARKTPGFQDLVDHIFAELMRTRKATSGITLPAFLQLVEMERKTCTLKIRSHGRKGYLYFLEGDLMDADNGVDKLRRPPSISYAGTSPRSRSTVSAGKRTEISTAPWDLSLWKGSG